MVDWDLAQRVAAGALILKPAPATYRSAELQAQFDELTARAEFLVSEATGSALGARGGAGQGDRSARMGRGQRPLHGAAGRAGAGQNPSRTAPARRSGSPRWPPGRVMSGTQLGPDAGLHVHPGAGPVRPPHPATRSPRTRTWSITSGPTWWRWRSGTGSCPASSVSGWPCTRSPTGCSSPPCPGCATTSWTWSVSCSSPCTPIPRG